MYHKVRDAKERMVKKDSENYIVREVLDEYGHYTVGTLILIKGKLYQILNDKSTRGCKSCDLPNHLCQSDIKPFQCSQDIAGDWACLKLCKEGV